MKVYLDDERPTPPGWHRCYWPEEVITLLQAEFVTHLSLDHDLGDDERGTGYDVLLWLEEQVVINDLAIPCHMQVHSANNSASVKMNLAIGSIQRHATHKISE